jgi:hypothetical protein
MRIEDIELTTHGSSHPHKNGIKISVADFETVDCRMVEPEDREECDCVGCCLFGEKGVCTAKYLLDFLDQLPKEVLELDIDSLKGAE